MKTQTKSVLYAGHVVEVWLDYRSEFDALAEVLLVLGPNDEGAAEALFDAGELVSLAQRDRIIGEGEAVWARELVACAARTDLEGRDPRVVLAELKA